MNRPLGLVLQCDLALPFGRFPDGQFDGVADLGVVVVGSEATGQSN